MGMYRENTQCPHSTLPSSDTLHRTISARRTLDQQTSEYCRKPISYEDDDARSAAVVVATIGPKHSKIQHHHTTTTERPATHTPHIAGPWFNDKWN